MTIVITLGLHKGRIGGIFILGIFTLSGGIFYFQNRNSWWPWCGNAKLFRRGGQQGYYEVHRIAYYNLVEMFNSIP